MKKILRIFLVVLLFGVLAAVAHPFLEKYRQTALNLGSRKGPAAQLAAGGIFLTLGLAELSHNGFAAVIPDKKFISDRDFTRVPEKLLKN